MRFNDLTDKKFNKLTVVCLDHREGIGNAAKCYWKCKCDCGGEVVVRGSHLKANGIKSCGCLSYRKGNQCPTFRGYGEIPKKYFSRIRTGATSRGRNFIFLVSIEYLWELFLKQNRRCTLIGWFLSFDDRTASLDRIDSSKGYVEGNVQWVHKDINVIKSNYDQDYFIKLCKGVATLDNNKTDDRMV